MFSGIVYLSAIPLTLTDLDFTASINIVRLRVIVSCLLLEPHSCFNEITHVMFKLLTNILEYSN